MQNISQRTKKARRALGLSQTAFAERMGFSRNYIGMVESGKQQNVSHRFEAEIELIEKEIDAKSSPQERPIVGIVDTSLALHVGGPRGLLKAAMQSAGLNPASLAKKINYQIGVVQAVVDGGARIKEEMAERIENLHIGVTAEELMQGSETPKIIDPTGATGTVGSKPSLHSLGAGRVRMIPLISMAEAGPNINFEDEIFQHEAVAVSEVSDAKAFALRIHGDSMEPKISPGDKVVVCPGWKPRNGDEVICRTVEGDVMCKIYQTKFNGKFVILSSYNPAFPARELAIEEIEWIYPIQSIIKTRREK